MSGIHHYWLFVAAGVLLNLTPGQDTLFIVGRSLTGGFRAGVAATGGVMLGTCCHTLAAALGLSLLLATSATAFTTVKLLGAAYLIYLGVRLVLAPAGAAAQVPVSRPASAPAALLQGLFTNLLNPKVALFFLAFLPQFVDPQGSERTLALLALGATFLTTGFLWGLVLAAGAARLQAFFTRQPGARRLLDRAVGSLFIALGARLTWARQ
jgi:threonine/homoserine/homoserine lactone efflux protein